MTAAPSSSASKRVDVGLSAAVAVLIAGVSATGLWAAELYRDSAAVAAMFRGYDVVTLAVVAPLLGLTLLPALLHRPRAVLLRISLLVYCIYNYAYYLFGAELNAVLTVHVAIFALSLYALALSVAHLDLAGLPDSFPVRTPARSAAVILLLLGVSLAALQAWGLLGFAFAGTPLTEPSQLIVPATLTRLGAVLDLSLLVPAYLVGGVLLWRRRPVGYVLAAAVLVAGTLHQLSYAAGMASQIAADIPGAAFDSFEPVIALLYVIAAWLLLGNRGRRGDTVMQSQPRKPRMGDPLGA